MRRRSTGRAFTTTWWGKAWIRALEQRAQLDPNRLPRGRTYARHHHVHDLEIGPGEITALVQGSRPTPYRVRVRLRRFGAAEWDSVFTAIAARAAHAAALLDGELDPGIVDEAADVGVDLLPGPGELQPRCSCPDWADPCKHSAAVCYLVAQALDADPFGLFLLRGLHRDAVLSGVRHHRSDGPAPGGDRPGRTERLEPGVAATSAWRSAPAARSPRLRPPARPSVLAPLPPAASSAAFPGAAALEALRRDAVERAWRARTEGTSAGLDLGVEQDLARHADRVLDEGGIDELARHCGRTGRELVWLALAWRHGGARGVDLVTGAETPDPSPDVRAIVEAAAGEAARTGAAHHHPSGLDPGWRAVAPRAGQRRSLVPPRPRRAGVGAPPTARRRRGRPPRRRLTDRVCRGGRPPTPRAERRAYPPQRRSVLCQHSASASCMARRPVATSAAAVCWSPRTAAASQAAGRDGSKSPMCWPRWRSRSSPRGHHVVGVAVGPGDPGHGGVQQKAIAVEEQPAGAEEPSQRVGGRGGVEGCVVEQSGVFGGRGLDEGGDEGVA